MKSSKELIKNIDFLKIIGDIDKNIENIAVDSRKVSKNTLYFAIKGATVDGHDFIESAIKNGAVVIICSNELIIYKNYPEVAFVIVENILKTQAIVVNEFYDYPSKKAKVIGITGTNGKTSSTFILESIFKQNGKKVGVIGTIGYKINETLTKLENTTPNSLELTTIFVEMLNNEVDIIIMEVSSHALELYRVYGIHFDCVVFTNLTQDHLDFHLTMENYYNAKKKLFTEYMDYSEKENKICVINTDDFYGKKLFDELTCKKTSFGKEGDYKVIESELTLKNITLKIKSTYKIFSFTSKLVGQYNVMNILGALTVADKIGTCKFDIEDGIHNVNTIKGRLEYVDNPKKFNIFVDYAHSPDAIENVLSTTKPLTKGLLIALMGAGGDRDKTKRKLMTQSAMKYADLIILTSDNPRTENPEDILNELESPLLNSSIKYKRISDRKEAIEFGLSLLTEKDCFVICGKGHEDYQIIGKTKYHFSDSETVIEYYLV